MSYLADVNVLLALSYGRHGGHRAAFDWLTGVDSRAAVGICRVTQLGLCRLLSNARVMGEDALDPEAAWVMGQGLLGDDRFVFLTEGVGLEEWMEEFMRGRRTSQSLWTDAYLAALAKSRGWTLVTFDRGFGQFRGLEWVMLG